MKFTNIILKKFRNFFYKNLKRGIELRKLGSIDDNTLNSIVRALKHVINDNVSKEEKFWVDKIENLRRNLLNSTNEITIIDCGAISPNICLTAVEKDKGRILKKTIGEATKGSVPYIRGLLLFKLIREFQPLICLELGTALGISSSYQSAALELNNRGRIVTIEGTKSVAEVARQNHKILGLSRVITKIGKFKNVLETIINEIKPVDFVFIDGHHEETATLNYFNTIVPSLSDYAILVFDDIGWSKGMKRAWKALTQDNRIKFAINLIGIGICVISKSESKKRDFKLLLK